jgi:hypothetical protein
MLLSRSAFVASLLILGVVAWRAFVPHPMAGSNTRSGVPTAAIEYPNEQRLDSATLAEMSSMEGVSHKQAGRLIAILDPTSPGTSALVRAIEILDGSAGQHLETAVLFSAPFRIHNERMSELLLTLECARNDHQLAPVLDAISGRPPADIETLTASAARVVPNPARLCDCIRRRDSQERVSNSAWLVSHLHLIALPVFLLDSVAIRGNIGIDSLVSRLSAAGWQRKAKF